MPDPKPRDAPRGAKVGDSFAADLASAAGAAAAPPPEVSAEVRDAARAAARLHELGRELRFDHDVEGRLTVELRDTTGNLLRPVPTAEVFDFAEGKVTS